VPTETSGASGGIGDAERIQLLIQSFTDYAIYSLSPDGLVISWNSGAERIKGYAAHEIIGAHFSGFFTDEDKAAGLPQRALAAARRLGRFESEGWRRRKDGSRFWATAVLHAVHAADGTFVGFAKITRDTSERRAAQQALEESERRFRLLVQGVLDYAIYLLDPSGIVVNWNAGAERIKGYAAEDIVGRHFSCFYTAEDRAAGAPAKSLDTAAREGKCEAEGWRVRKDGSFFWASVVVDAIYDQGVLIGFAKITRDITERREAQMALQKVHQQLAESRKMDALGQLTGGVAHDFNNLLMIVSGHVQTLKKLAADDPKAARAAEAIELATRRGATLTRQLLTFSRRQRLNPAAISIAEQLETFHALLTSGLGGARLAIRIPAGVWPVKVDAGEFESALVNLVVNARDAMPEGGTVTISAENVVLEPSGGDALAGEFVAMTVADTGTGIPDDVRDKIFDPFFTTKPVGKGTGLGLSQVHGFAHQAGGTIRVDSAVGQGTRMTLYLPRAARAPEASTRRDDTGHHAGSGIVLLVEDNPDVAGATTVLLDQLGYRVRGVNDADAALRALDDDIDLVFTDIVMPGRLDGLALARAIRQKHPGLPVLLATGYSDAARSVNSEFPILHKPYQIGDLSRALAGLHLGRRSNLVPFQARKRTRGAKASGDP
jgi:PAS domain S-box-containing protein